MSEIGDIITEPFVKCSFCNIERHSQICVRARKEMIFILEDESIERHPPGTVICQYCLEKRKKGN